MEDLQPSVERWSLRKMMSMSIFGTSFTVLILLIIFVIVLVIGTITKMLSSEDLKVWMEKPVSDLKIWQLIFLIWITSALTRK